MEGTSARKLGWSARPRGFPLRRFRYSAGVTAPRLTPSAGRCATPAASGPSRAVLVAAAATLAGCIALLVVIGRRVGAAVDGPTDLMFVVAAAIAGVLAADFASGVVHWACDTFFDETTPLLGAALIAPFREHHHDPLAMTRRTFLDVNSSNWFALLPILACTAWCDAALTNATSLCWHAFLVTFAPATSLTNQFHQWAHTPNPPRLVRRLQHAHLVLAPAVHDRHHAIGHGSAYCVTGGWLNPALDRIDFFGRLERGIRACRRAVPRASGEEPAA